ncbi:hypothetical protein Tco_0605461 [Tanacetum coccineum]
MLFRYLTGVVTNDMYQSWRALATIINLCLMGKSSGFERPRAPVLQILWGVVNGANIDYAKRIWEEFTQCIHSFTEDKMNLALHAEGKKKVNPLVILAKGATTKSTRKPKLQSSKTTPVAKPAASKTSKSSASQPSKPTPAPAKPQQKKIKLAEGTTEAPSQAKRSKAGNVLKKRTLSNTPQLVDEFVDEGVLDKEPMHGDEEADTQRAVEERLKEAQGAQRGLLPPIVFRKPNTGKIQPLPEVEGKGKEKVGEEQAAHVLLNLQTPKKKNPAEQFIFQRRTPATTKPSSLFESSSLYAELGLTDSEMDSDEEVSPDMNAQGQEECQGGTNPGDAGVSQTPSSNMVYARPNLDHMDLGITEASSQPNTEQMDDEFTSTAYPKVQENLKLPTEGDVRLEEPASSAGTLSSMKNLDKEFSFTDQFLDTSYVPLMTTPVIDITDPQSDSTMVPASMPTITATVTETTTITTVPPPPPQPQQDVLTSILTQMIVQHAMRAPLCARFKDLPTSDMKEILLQRMLEENYDKGHEDHKMAFEALQKSIIRDESKQFDADKAKERTKKKNPPPPPPSSTTNQGDQSYSSAAPGLKPAASSVPEDVRMHEESDFKAQDMGFDDEDSGSRHISKVSLNQEWFKPLSEEERLATPEPAWSIPSSSLTVPNNNWASAIASSFVSLPENSLLSQTGDIRVFIDWFSKKQGITKLTLENLESPAYEVVKAFHPDGGPTRTVTIQTEFFFNKDLEYLRFGHKGDRLALSITKMKAASYPDAGLEQMVPDQMWAEEEYMYDISASYGISHWWFKRQQFYIDRHSADTNRRAIVRTHMRILSVVRIEVFSLYGYDYMKKIVLRRADNQEYTIAESDFKDLYPSDFEDLYLLNLQESYQTQLNLTKPHWEATGLEFMHDYKILDSPRAVVFRDKYGML